ARLEGVLGHEAIRAAAFDERRRCVLPAGRAELLERPDHPGAAEVDRRRILVVVAVARMPRPTAPVERSLRVGDDRPYRLLSARLVPLGGSERLVLGCAEELRQRRRGGTRATRGASLGRSRDAGSPASPRR